MTEEVFLPSSYYKKLHSLDSHTESYLNYLSLFHQKPKNTFVHVATCVLLNNKRLLDYPHEPPYDHIWSISNLRCLFSHSMNHHTTIYGEPVIEVRFLSCYIHTCMDFM